MNVRINACVFLVVMVALLFTLNCTENKASAESTSTPEQKKLQSLLAKSNNHDSTASESKPDHITSIDGLDELNSIISSTPGRLLVFDLYADWCMPCKMLAPLYDSLASTHRERASFFRVDVQRHQDVAQAFRVQSIPLVVFIKDKEIVHSVPGLNTRNHYEKILTTCSAASTAAECKKKLEELL